MPELIGYNPDYTYEHQFIDIENIQDARDHIREVMERGEYPILTIPKKFKDEIKTGLLPKATWIGMPLLAGTLVREPYLPGDEERVLLRIKVDPNRVEPRFTGPDKHYHGIVVFRGPISPDEIEEINPEQYN